MPRRASPDGPAVHTTLRIPKPLHDKLAAAAGANGVAEEIKRRLDASFEDPFRGSPATREALRILARVARMLDRAYGDWSEKAYARAVMAAAAQNVFPPPNEKPAYEPPSPGSNLIAGSGEIGADGLGAWLVLLAHGDDT